MAKCSCFLSRSLKYRKGHLHHLLYLLLWTMYTINEKDPLSTCKPRPFPSAYFYAFSGKQAALYKKAHYGLSLSSFPAFSSRKDCRANLVSFMLVKVSEWSSSQYRFNLFQPYWTINGKYVSYPPKKGGRALMCTNLSLFRNMRLSMKKRPHWSLLPIFRLSKIENTIKHLLSRAC